jgi:UDP-glucuronate 4-epimerase
MQRDFTYIDDVVEEVIRTSDKATAPNPDWDGKNPDPGTSQAPFRVYNIGNNTAVELSYVISLLEKELGRRAEQTLLPMQPGDLRATCADVDDLMRDVGYRPSTSIEDGVHQFVSWFREYHGS